MKWHDITEKWSNKYKRSINCNNPKGFSQKAHCAGRKKKESIEEGYKLKLERDANVDVLHIVNTDTGGRTEVRGKKGYESGNYDPNDKLHQLLDRVGKSANIAELINGEVVSINPKHPDGAKAKAATDKAYNEKSYNNHVGHDDLLSMPKNTLVIDTPGDLDWYKIGQHFPTLNKADPREFGQGDSDMVITFASDKEKEVLRRRYG